MISSLHCTINTLSSLLHVNSITLLIIFICVSLSAIPAIVGGIIVAVVAIIVVLLIIILIYFYKTG